MPHCWKSHAQAQMLNVNFNQGIVADNLTTMKVTDCLPLNDTTNLAALDLNVTANLTTLKVTAYLNFNSSANLTILKFLRSIKA